ncbi:Diacylglycerol kinase zeta [Lamellibrachia satsuma]|nr:Diacylglycerol kinase zeta [Lamellibrachia satsuma]
MDLQLVVCGENRQEQEELIEACLFAAHHHSTLPASRGPYLPRGASIKDANKQLQKAINKSTQDNSNLLHPSHAEYGYQKRDLRSSIDWTEAAVNGDHMWTDTSASGDFCYVGEGACSRTGQRKKCAACKILIHTGCLAELERIKVNYKCKSTFREAGPRNYRENTSMRHHWVHRRRQEGKCKQCSKSFQQRFTFQSKEIIAISCSWCKVAYHNKVSCFMMQQIEEQCTLGVHAGIIIPPSWIIKLPRKGSFKSSLRKKKRSTVKKRKSTDHKPFIIKPIPSPHMKPLLVFINPKSGGNQGAKLLHKFQWLLNPRQVFDLSQGGPVMALELFKKVPNLRILVCGGDGTAGWILSTIDALEITPMPPMAVLPLGTGNDLARTLNWGGGYTDEPISKILCSVEEGPVVELDRWSMKCDPNTDCEQESAEQESWEKKLPLEIMNNYFSLGADANVTLEFHESREANPEKFNSRFKNKMFYAGAGGKDLLKRSWKNLADHITIECDGKDLTAKIKELKVHCLVFLNIPRYAAGTQPWGTPSVNNTSFEPQRHDDGLLEVIGFTMTALATLQVGGHGLRLAQCQTVRLTTTKTIPVQVDGEPCKLAPSVVSISLRNRASVIKKPKHRGLISIGINSTTVPQKVQVRLISMTDYEALHYDKEKLKEASMPLDIVVETGMDLEQVRSNIKRRKVGGSEETQKPRAGQVQNLSNNWCFVDSTTAERFFRIDRAQENIHYVTDITSEDLYILDTDLHVSFLQNGCDQGIRSTPETSNTAPQLTTLSTVIIPDTPEVRVTYNMPITPPRSPGMIAPPPSVQQVNNQAPPPEPRISSEPETLPVVLSLTQPSCVDLSPCILIEDMKEKLLTLNKKLTEAAKEGNIKLVKELHAEGANLLSVDGDNMTPLHHAAKLGSHDVVKYLIDNAPHDILDMTDSEHGETALLKAARYQRRQICSLLVTAGASASKTDSQGNTPRQQALKAEDKELATYLESREQFQIVIATDKETAV